MGEKVTLHEEIRDILEREGNRWMRWRSFPIQAGGCRRPARSAIEGGAIIGGELRVGCGQTNSR